MATKKQTKQPQGDPGIYKGQPAIYTGKTKGAFGKTLYEVVVTEGRNIGQHGFIAQAPCALPTGTSPVPPTDERAMAVAEAKQARRPAIPKLAPGMALVRTFRGKQITVEVTERGFEYDGQVFKSISACAKYITGYGISGPVFFGLAGAKVQQPNSDA